MIHEANRDPGFATPLGSGPPVSPNTNPGGVYFVVPPWPSLRRLTARSSTCSPGRRSRSIALPRNIAEWFTNLSNGGTGPGPESEPLWEPWRPVDVGSPSPRRAAAAGTPMTVLPKKATLNERQRRLLEFLKEQERRNATFGPDEIAAATGYKRDSVRTNMTEGHWSQVVVRAGKDRFRAGPVSSLSEREFHARISQSKRVQAFGYRCSNPLAAGLLSRSRDNMVLALELYNRPSLINRLDGFVMLFCAAWEQMLKAQLIERDGEDSIFHSYERGQTRRSIGLTNCIERVFDGGGPVRRNLEDIQEFRDRAVHLLMPPLQPLASRLFQAGVLNFARHFREQAGEPFVPHSAVGLLTLVNDLSDPQTVGFDAAYGAKTAEELAALIEQLSSAVRDENSWSYAVPITYRLVFSDKGVASDFTVTKLAHDALDARTIAVIEKPRERKHTHPYLPRRAVTEIGKRLEADLSTSQLAQHLGVRAGATAAFNTFDFEAVQFVERWRTANNEFHHHDDEIHRRWFSQRAIDVAVEKICKDAEYLKRARASLKASRSRSSLGSESMAPEAVATGPGPQGGRKRK